MELLNNWFFQSLFCEIIFFLSGKIILLLYKKLKNFFSLNPQSNSYVYSNKTLKFQFYICLSISKFLIFSYIFSVLKEHLFSFITLLLIFDIFMIFAFESAIDMIEYYKNNRNNK